MLHFVLVKEKLRAEDPCIFFWGIFSPIFMKGVNNSYFENKL